ncbi:MAG: ATP-binding protein, partial [Bacteroidia bacterium]
MRRILLVTRSKACKEIFEKVDHPPFTKKEIVSDVNDAISNNQKVWYSLVVLEQPTAKELSGAQAYYKSATILCIFKCDNVLSNISSFIEELHYYEFNDDFIRIIEKKLHKLIEIRELRRKQILNDRLFEFNYSPTIVARKVGNGDFETESFNHAFQDHSILNKKVILGAKINLFDLYSATEIENKGNEKVAHQTRCKQYRNIESEVDIIVRESKLRDSDIVYQVAVETHTKVDFDAVNRLSERLEYIEKSKNAQSEFLASIAHDIRKPLNNIIGLTELLGESDIDEEQQYIGKSLTESSQNLKNLINDLLDSSKIDSGHFEINNAYFEIRPFIENLRTMFLKEAKSRGLDFKVYTDDEIPVWLEGDKNRLSQIIVNLLSNAFKFTKEGTIELNIGLNEIIKDKAYLNFKVVDSGIGIDNESLERIFESYSQAHGQIKTQFGGTGLGLTICKKLTKLMGGSIKVESEIGKGSTFFFEIPFGNTAVKDLNEENEADDVLKGLDILVIDDNEIAAFVVKNLVCQKGATAQVAYTGKQAVDLFKAGNY